MAAAAASTLTSSASSSSLPRLRNHTFLQLPPFLLSPNPKPSKSLKLTFQTTLFLPLLRPLSPVALFRCAAASDGLDEQPAESGLSESETDQLLEQEHEQEHAAEEGEGEEDKPATSQDGRLYVGNLPYSITSSQLAEIFGEAGAVQSVEIIYDRLTDRSRGFAFVTMGSVEDAEKAIRMFDSSQIGGRTVKVNFPEVPRGGERRILEPKIKTSYQSFVDTPNKVYAGNLSWGLTSQGLRDAFSGQPGFLSAKVIFERETGRSRGFGFVSFSSVEEARSAITAMNGVEVEGRPLRLNMASERAPSSPPSVDIDSEESMDESEVLSGVSS